MQHYLLATKHMSKYQEDFINLGREAKSCLLEASRYFYTLN